jgi:hypothetical protein
MVVQDRIQLATPLLVCRIVAGSWKQVAKTEEAANQWPTTRSQKAEALTRSSASNYRFGFVLENHRLRGDSAHRSARITRRSSVLSHGLARLSKLLDCRGRRRPAASEAAHVPTLAPLTACQSSVTWSISTAASAIALRWGATDVAPRRALVLQRAPFLGFHRARNLRRLYYGLDL